jgi:hypothetical protein
MILDELEIALLSPEAATDYARLCREAYYAADDVSLHDKLHMLDTARFYCPHAITVGEDEHKHCIDCWVGFDLNGQPRGRRWTN